MIQIKIGDQVESLNGKFQGQSGKVTGIDKERVLVQFDGIQYEMSFAQKDIKVIKKHSDDFVFKGDSVPPDFHGDKKWKVIRYLIRNKKLCPSWPYCCTGNCKTKS
jgi:hypothetical protein